MSLVISTNGITAKATARQIKYIPALIGVKPKAEFIPGIYTTAVVSASDITEATVRKRL